MENGHEDHEDIQIEEIPDEFQCCVCLELLYKPVVLGCGHIACFWCIFKAMNTWRESNCPICRHPYHHFPSFCRLIHSLLLKLYPLASARRVKQVAEEEKEVGSCSPEFDDDLSESRCKTDLVPDTASPHSVSSQKCGSAGEGDHSSIDVSLDTVVPATSSSEINKDAISKNLNFADEHTSASEKQVLMTDLLCGICELLLSKPVVLNCGHVYCENCVINPSDKLCRCPVCQLEHPNGYPNICLILEHYLEEQFPELYAERKRASVERSDCQIPSKRNRHEAAGCKSVPGFDLSAWFTGGGPQVHFGVGCDYCGMCPIVGERYKCKDCKEKIGFDLCEGCYKSSSKLPGRFNQQHTPEHQFELIQALQVRNVVLRLQPERLEGDDSDLQLEYGEPRSLELRPLEEDSSETNSPRDDLRDGQVGNISSSGTGDDDGGRESADRD
ncbi:E3 ubiquitin-protein ligase PRT1 [Solanum tuberosum]|uniref:E3 ubiquitin-protein ligase PRT1 n=1 Tax=Solanum tuberosum TaxID=4113 RepID=M1CWI2_SOLTU|nr:PREDICTED: E3 ubiquitin-protein ligase PRT1 [Solanum tuberosum]